jgi:Ca2+-binding EF-hand superfamily protein
MTEAYASLPAELEGLSDKQLSTIREAFMAFAGDSMVLLKTDLAACLRTLSYRISEVEVRRLAEEIAPSGRIDYMGV